MNKIWAAMVVMFLVSCADEAKVNRKMSDSPVIMKAHCVGRHVIDLPAVYLEAPVTTGIFQFSTEDAQQPTFDVTVRSENFSVGRFDREIARRRAELKSLSDDTTNILRSDRMVDGDSANIFSVQVIDDAYKSEIIFLRGSSIITVQLDSYENTFAEAESKLINFSKKVKEKASGKLSAISNAFCLGPVEIEGEFNKEVGSYLFKGKEHMRFELEVDTFTKDESISLLQRMKGPDSLLAMFKVDHTVLRAGERNAAGMRAQEWLGWARLDEGPKSKTYKFALETLRKNPGKSRPSISLTFNAASSNDGEEATGPLITEEDAIRTWDLVVGSIR